MFEYAKPIWVENRETEINCRVQFKAFIPFAENAFIHIATSGIYQLWINGKFVSYGPARAGRGHFRMENLEITDYLKEGDNAVVIEVAGYYCKSFYVQQQPSFLQAEVVSGDSCLAATGKDFSARLNPYYYRKIQRYSYQRTFAESYDYSTPADSFFTDNTSGGETLTLTEEKTVIERKVPYPEFRSVSAKPHLSGKIQKISPVKYVYDRYCVDVGMGEDDHTGWREAELDCMPERDYQEMMFVPDGEGDFSITRDRYSVYKFPYNATGMICFDIVCDEPTTVYVSFDEIIEDKKIRPTRERVGNIIRLELSAGTHHFHSFEVYTFKYLQISCLGGNCRVMNLSVVEYKHPPVKRMLFKDAEIQLIADAAVETFCQNSVDIFVDCPSRERAGWLCDSYFTAKTERTLTGENIIEESFLENFLHEDNYIGLPKGMLPMCYPSDSKMFIPNWAMWLVVELGDYYKRTGNADFVNRFKNKVYNLIEYFKKFENSDGLLEDLEGWIMLEWSRANDDDLVSGINYPSNMMYYAMLDVAAELYGDSELSKKAERIKKYINENAFNGTFYVDHAERLNGTIVQGGESTEVCQYYALFAGIADKTSHPEFFKRMVEEFGPNRDTEKVWKDVYPAAPFIGNYLRLEILMRYGYKDIVVENIRDYFLYMAETTGTLWEKAVATNSCNHGFASCVLAWLADCDLATK